MKTLYSGQKDIPMDENTYITEGLQTVILMFCKFPELHTLRFVNFSWPENCPQIGDELYWVFSPEQEILRLLRMKSRKKIACQ